MKTWNLTLRDWVKGGTSLFVNLFAENTVETGAKGRNTMVLRLLDPSDFFPNVIGTSSAVSLQRGDKMRSNTVQGKTQKNFLDIPTAAYEAGYSPRHFRRIIEEDGIPVLQIGRKFFILSREFEAWKSTKGEARLDQAIQQLDKWLKQSPKGLEKTVDDIQEED